MAKYVIGIDGGGTKTAFAAAGLDGRILSEVTLESTNHREFGFETVAERLRSGIRQVLQPLNASLADVGCIGAGIPCYGEDAGNDRVVDSIFEELASPAKYALANDGAIAYYGALSGRPGINVVAGTGTIAFGKDHTGRLARSGGWSEHFSDEGSCYWLGRMAMSLFCKEADGREEKSALYQLFRDRYQLKEDFDILPHFEGEIMPYRGKVAAQQRVLLEAANLGDAAAVRCYEAAAEEIALIARGVRSQLDFTSPVEVSVTGGLTYAMKYVEPALTRCLAWENMIFTKAECLPVQGAVYMALEHL